MTKEKKEFGTERKVSVSNRRRTPSAPSRLKERNYMAAYRAEKIGGSYQAIGTVITEFDTLAGHRRCVFEFDAPRGMLHIFNMDQVRRLPLPDED